MTAFDFQDFKKYYAELRGATLFLYKDDTQDTVREPLSFEEFIHIHCVLKRISFKHSLFRESRF